MLFVINRFVKIVYNAYRKCHIQNGIIHACSLLCLQNENVAELMLYQIGTFSRIAKKAYAME